MDILPYLFAFIALIAILTFATMAWTVVGIRLKRGVCDEAGREELPQYLVMLFEDQQKKLSCLGFQHSHYQRFDLPFVNNYSIKYAAVMVQGDQKTYAVIIPSDLPEPGEVCNLEFLTRYTDSTRLITMNNILHRLAGEFPDSLVYDPYAETPEIQWSAHLKNLAEHVSKERAEVLPPEEFIADVRGFMDKYIDGLESRKDITKEGEDGSFGAISSLPVCALQSRLRERAQRFGESISDGELLREIFILLKDKPFSTAPFARSSRWRIQYQRAIQRSCLPSG